MASYFLCCFLLQLLFGAVLAGTEMLALSGMSFLLFSNLTFHELMTLYRNGNQDHVMIARWEVKNATFTSIFLHPKYTGKIFMEIDKTPVIWICNVDQTLSAKYIVQYGINTTGPEVKLTIMENKQLDVCLNSPPNSPEKCFGKLTDEQVVQHIEKFLDDHPQYVKRHFDYIKEHYEVSEASETLKEFKSIINSKCGTGNLTEDEFQKWLDNHPGFMKKYFGTLTGEQIGQEVRKWLADHPEYIKDYLEKVMPEQMLPCNHPKEVMKESSDGWNPLFLGLLIVSCIIGMLILIGIIILLCILANKLPKEDQVHKWLNNHPDFMDKYHGKLTEDQIWKQIQKWEDAYPGLLKNKYLDAHENDQVFTPTLEELSVTLTQHSRTGIEGDPNQSVSTQATFHASQHSDEDVSNNQTVITTSVEPPVTLTESGNEIEGNQMLMPMRKMFASQSSDEDGNDYQAVRPTLVEPLQVQMMSTQKTFNASQSSDELVNHDTATKPTLIELAVTWCGPVTGTEDNQGQLELSSICNSLSSVTFSEPGHSGTQPFNNDEQDANPEQDMARDVRVVIEDSDSEDKCQEPLLQDQAKM